MRHCSTRLLESSVANFEVVRILLIIQVLIVKTEVQLTKTEPVLFLEEDMFILVIQRHRGIEIIKMILYRTSVANAT